MSGYSNVDGSTASGLAATFQAGEASTKLCHTPIPCNINAGCAEHSTKPMVEHNIKTGS